MTKRYGMGLVDMELAVVPMQTHVDPEKIAKHSFRQHLSLWPISENLPVAKQNDAVNFRNDFTDMMSYQEDRKS